MLFPRALSSQPDHPAALCNYAVSSLRSNLPYDYHLPVSGVEANTFGLDTHVPVKASLIQTDSGHTHSPTNRLPHATTRSSPQIFKLPNSFS